MDSCPKCGSGDIIGPRYGRGAYGGEHLRYECRRCGYHSLKNTLDHKPHPMAQTVEPCHLQKPE